MKRLLNRLLLSCFLITIGSSLAFATQVTLRVDVAGQTVGTNGVHFAGDIVSPNWSPVDGPMTNVGGDIWEVTITMDPGSSGEFKFLLDNDWSCGCDESNNRQISIPIADAVVIDYTFNSYPSTTDVTLTVDASAEAVSANGMHAAGDFLPVAWSPADGAMTDNGDGTWSYAVAGVSGSGEFKFLRDNDWGCGCDESSNRMITFNSADSMEILYTFNSYPEPETGGEGVSVTLQVDVGCQTVGANGVHVAGSFQSETGNPNGDWDPAGTPLTNIGNGIWEVTITGLTPGELYEYKFLLDNFWGTDESAPSDCGVPGSFGNRFVIAPDEDAAIDLVCFGECGPCQAEVVDVTFRVNTSGIAVSANGVHMAGNFNSVISGAGLMNVNNYPDWNPVAIPLTEVSTDCWEVTIEGLPACKALEYKFLTDNDWACGCDENLVGQSCEIGGGNGNRQLNIPQPDANGGAVLPRVCFNSCTDCAIDLVLQVDMSLTGADPAGVLFEGGFDGSSGLSSWGTGNQMYDDGTNGDLVAGDGIYSLLIPNYDQIGTEYKFTNGPGNYEPVAGPGPFGNRILDAECGAGLVYQSAVCYGLLSACPELVEVTLQMELCDGNANPTGVYVSGATSNGNGGFFDQMAQLGSSNVYSVSLLLNADSTYVYSYQNGVGNAESIVRELTVTGNDVINVVAFDSETSCDGGTANYEIDRQGALCAASNYPTDGNEIYTWYNELGEVVASFVGVNCYSPSELGAFCVVITDPDGGPVQKFNPYAITTLDGCCELDD